jgi:cation transport regulator ChaB
MPFARNSDLPKGVRSALPAAAQAVWRKVANSEIADGLSEERAFRAAWSTLKRQGWRRGAGGRWSKVGKAFGRKVEFLKIDEDRRLVFGWFSEIEKDGERVVDEDEDYITEEDLETAAYAFNLEGRIGGLNHARVGKSKPVQVGRLIESMMFTKAKQELLGIDLDRVGWWGGFYVDDDDTWKDVKDKKFVSFSVGGTGTRLEE